jgi:anti-sigma B factor antagonist
MRTETEREPGVSTIRIEGEIDVSQAIVLREDIGAALGVGVLVLADLSAVPFIDSSGIGILVTAHRLALANGGVFAIVAPSEQVGQVLRMTRADKLLNVFDSAESATSALKGS